MEKYDDLILAKTDINASGYTVVYIPNNRLIPLYWQLSELISKKEWYLAYNDAHAIVGVKLNKKGQ